MAAPLTFYLKDAATTGAGNAAGWEAMGESAVAAATMGTGWVVGTGATNHSELQSRNERASSTFTGTTVPDGSLDTSLKDAIHSEISYNGSFASANWSFTFAVRSPTQGGAADGRVRFRLIKADADGSNATEITSGQQQASVVTNVDNASDFESALSFNPGAFSLTNQFLFVQAAWERTGAGGMTTTNIRFRTGSSGSAGTRIVTADFTPTPTTYTKTASLDAAIQLQGLTLSASLDAAVALRNTSTASLDAAIRAALTATAGQDAAILLARTAGASLDAAIQRQLTDSVDLDAVIALRNILTAGLDAAVATSHLLSLGMDAFIEGVDGVVLSLPIGARLTAVKTPVWGTSVFWSRAKTRYAVGQQDWPLYRIELSIEVLRESASLAEMRDLMGFFNQRAGRFGSFLYADPDDYAVEDQLFGLRDGVETEFQLVRSFGGYTEPVQNVSGVAGVKSDGVPLSDGVDYSVDRNTGILTLADPGTPDEALTWSGSYYWRVAFDDNQMPFGKMFQGLWELKKLLLIGSVMNKV